MGSTTLISSAFTALLNCAEVGRRNRILTNYRFLSHSLFGQSRPGNYCLPDCSIFQKSVTAPRDAEETMWAYLPKTPRLYSGGKVVSAFINILPGVSDAFALITASSSGVYIAIYILTMLAHLKYRKSKEFMPDGFIMPAYKVLNPLTIVFFLFVFVCLFLQESTYIGAIGATIWIILFGIYSNWKHNK